MQKCHRVHLALSALLALAACDQGITSRGLIHLPEGDAAKGKEHFVSLGCTACHTVRGVELPTPALNGPVQITLGSRAGRVKRYGDLVTSIVNPSHKLSGPYPKSAVSEDGESIMTVFNDVMTVRQLSDLVAFLQDHYEKVSRPRYRYPVYRYGSDDG